MSGFRDLLNVLGAIDSRGKSVIDTFGGSDLARATAEVERLSALLATIADPTRQAGIASQLEAAKETLKVLESRGGGATAADSPSASPVERVSFQIGRMRTEMAAATQEAERTLESLSFRADEVTSEVQVKVSRALAAILDPGNGPGVSGKFDKDTGQFLGGAFSFEAARDLVDRYNELLELQKTARAGAEQFFVNESIKQTASFFQRVFGSELGSIKSLAKQLREFMAQTAKNERGAMGPTSGTLGRGKTSAPTATSLAVLRWSGGLR